MTTPRVTETPITRNGCRRCDPTTYTARGVRVTVPHGASHGPAWAAIMAAATAAPAHPTNPR